MNAQPTPAPFVLTLGESMGLFRQETPGALHTQRTLGFGFGGAESNVAIALSRLGTPVCWLGRIGEDGIGDVIERELRAEGVIVRAIRDNAAPTGLMVKERPVPKSTRVVYYRAGSAGSRLDPADLPEGLVEAASLLHVTGITPALSPSADAAIEAAMVRARAAGVPVSLDINYRSALWTSERAAARMRELLPLADIVFAGDDEAAMVLGDLPTAELAAGLAAFGPREAVIKLGERGCYALVDGVGLGLPAVSVEVVDTVGAGDAFVGGYLAEWLEGHPLSDRLAVAVAAGAFACLSSGDWEGLPRRQDLALLGDADPVRR